MVLRDLGVKTSVAPVSQVAVVAVKFKCCCTEYKPHVEPFPEMLPSCSGIYDSQILRRNIEGRIED